MGSVSVDLPNTLDLIFCQRGSSHTVWWSHLWPALPQAPPQLVATTVTTAVVSAFLPLHCFQHAVKRVHIPLAPVPHLIPAVILIRSPPPTTAVSPYSYSSCFPRPLPPPAAASPARCCLPRPLLPPPPVAVSPARCRPPPAAVPPRCCISSAAAHSPAAARPHLCFPPP